MRTLLLITVFLITTPAFAQTVEQKGVTSQQINNFINNLSVTIRNGDIKGLSPEQTKSLQKGLVFSGIYGCSEDAVGKPRLDAFINDIRAVGKQVEQFCKLGKAEDARLLALSTLQARADDPVAIAAKQCYLARKHEVLSLLDSDEAIDAVKYERWANNTMLAEREAQAGDVCKGSPQVSSAPNATILSQPLKELP